MNKIDRANVNSPKVSASDFPKSGFDLTYKHYRDFVLGHLIPAGYQYIMPADKFQGSNDAKYTFNTLVVPEISDVQVSQHNFYVPFRAIDSTFQRAMVPDELNSMSASWRTPSFNLKAQAGVIASTIRGDETDSLEDIFNNDFGSDPSSYQATITQISNYKTVFKEGMIELRRLFKDRYNSDIIDQIEELGMSYLNQITVGTEFEKALTLILHAWFDAFIGRNSLLDTLGYLYLRDYDIKRIVSEIFTYLADDDQLTLQFDDLLNMISDIPQCEYALRAYYAIWYEHYRDPYLEKRSSNLPDWHDFGSTPILDGYSINLIYLLPRIRSWQKDMFVASMPDDICRHVFAPIIKSTESLTISDAEFNYENAEYDSHMPGFGGPGYANLQQSTLTYLDSITGSSKTIYCPLPKAVNDSLNTLTSNTYELDSYALDLRDLRKSQMLERYLKRNFYFGDEYQDRMLAHYGSKVSDNSIRRPHLLSSSVSTLNPVQEVANMTNEVTKAGTRIATAQDNASGDSYEFFAEEFGIVINMISIIPKAQYAGICPQNLLSQQTDFPIPEFANNNDEFGRNLEISISPVVGLQDNQTDNPGIFQFGHYPYAHAWRSRVDEVHGSFLDTRQDYTFRRFFGSDSADTTPHLNSSFIHCVPNLGMFEDTIRLNGQGYMTIDHHFYVERVLPTPVEEI